MNIQPVTDESGRVIAPPQPVIAARPDGPWNSNARPDGSWAGRIVCSWCSATVRDGDAALPASHTICGDCAVIFEDTL